MTNNLEYNNDIITATPLNNRGNMSYTLDDIFAVYRSLLPRPITIKIENYNPNFDIVIVRIKSGMKRCIECGRKTCYVVNNTTNIYGWRLCYEHLPIHARTLLREYYQRRYI
jgi:hypothetical protein